MNIIQSPRFQRAVKKLHKNQKQDLKKAIQAVIDDPFIGEQKKGSLSHLHVHKFKMIGQLTLLAYSYDGDTVTLNFVMFGSHENFYRDLVR
jgi:mRNA-degrading endonuclease RelE of RelBE toxin-antitoxin system